MRYLFLLICIGMDCIVAQEFDSLEKLLTDDFKSDEPGGIVWIKKDRDILFQKAIGVENIKTKTPISGNTIFNTGSISKTFVAYGILILESEGKLSLEDSLSGYFPDFAQRQLADKVKIKHLLSHSSGLPDIRNVSGRPDYYLSAKDRENFEPIKAMERLNFEPGTRFQYSNPAFNGLALIIEKVSGEAWQDYIRRKIFEPAGMSESRITNGAHPETGVAHAYEESNDGFKENDYGEFPTFAAAGNGGVWCSVLDLIKYEEAIREAKFLSGDGLASSREIQVSENVSRKVGYSWFIDPTEENDYGVTLVSHTGSQGGFRSFHFSIPEKKLTYIGLFNRPPANMDRIVREGLRLLKKSNWAERE